ncbi:electron transfer flavoprotein subunit beta/FixA family protein [Stetteria hydrogenophila]
MGDIVVLVKAALNPEAVKSTPDGRVDLESTPLRVNDVDRSAVEVAARLKGRLGGNVYSVTILTWGPASRRERELRMVVQEALAKGVDKAFILADDELAPGDPVSTASAVVSIIKGEGLEPDLIIAGEASVDCYTGQVAGRVAAKLGLPFISFARRLDVEEGRVVAERNLEDRVEVVEAPLPAVVSVTGEIASPRPPTLLQIRRAAGKPQVWLKASQLEGLARPRREIVDARLLAVGRKRVIIEGGSLEEVAERLLDALEKEGVLRI